MAVAAVGKKEIYYDNLLKTVGMVCPSCGYEYFSVIIDEKKAKIYYTCNRCQWKGEDDLPTN